MSGKFDRRLTAVRPDIAAAHLRGVIEAPRYVDGALEEIVCEVADLRNGPSSDSGLDTQAIRGERAMVYEIEEGWAWAQLQRDGYVGFLSAAALKPAGPAPTHRVRTLRTFLYPAASMKLPVEQALPLNAEVCVTDFTGDFARLGEEGFVWAGHLDPIDRHEPDFVAVAERFEGVPYLWGGKTALGLDCSGLVQTSLGAAGVSAPRDTDMQENSLGTAITIGPDLRGLQRGDLIFWKGHVGIMRDERTLIHANGHHMLVASEPVDVAVARIAAKSFGAIVSVKRLANA